MKFKNTFFAWLAVLVLPIIAFVIIAIPVWLIRPFAPQTESGLETAFWLKTWSPIITPLILLAVCALAVYLWIHSKRWFAKIFLILPLVGVLFCVWFARQNHFLWMFNPLEKSAYAKIEETDFVADNDMVLAVKINGEAVAYPVRQMAYHHVVQDVVGGKPITATY